jgi:Calcineurin-like phosphoesterase
MMKGSCIRRLLLAGLFNIALVSASSAQSWKFGVMADTQWGMPDDGKNPSSCAVDIVKVLNKQFIGKKVKFVIEVGDLVDKIGDKKTGTTAESIANAEDVRAAFAQELYSAGIGFFPVRGNHDSHRLSGAEFKRIYPQTQNGTMNATPANVFSVPNPDAATQPFPKQEGSPFTMGTNFSTPDPKVTKNLDWSGLTYSFDYNNARFVLVDQFAPLNAKEGERPDLTLEQQVPWISETLAGKPAGGHAFVFGHKGIISENHVDTLFGNDPTEEALSQNAFITAMYKNGVRYYIQGHDHMHNRALVSVTTGTPTDGVSPRVENIISSSDSDKFYRPNVPSNDEKYNVAVFGHPREAEVSQDLRRIGFYIYTVDGPRVTGEYYAAQVPNAAPNAKCKTDPDMCEFMIQTTPDLTFVKAETFGYSLNGKEFLVCQEGQDKCNSSYTQVSDTYNGTTAKILSGDNGSKTQDRNKRPFLKTVDTGWTDKDSDVASNILTLWGMTDLNSNQTDVYTLSLTDKSVGKGAFGLASKSKGKWINAVDKNQGGTKKYVAGPWKKGYGLGTYGFDAKTNTAWAVINYNGAFEVASLDK